MKTNLSGTSSGIWTVGPATVDAGTVTDTVTIDKVLRPQRGTSLADAATLMQLPPVVATVFDGTTPPAVNLHTYHWCTTTGGAYTAGDIVYSDTSTLVSLTPAPTFIAYSGYIFIRDLSSPTLYTKNNAASYETDSNYTTDDTADTVIFSNITADTTCTLGHSLATIRVVNAYSNTHNVIFPTEINGVADSIIYPGESLTIFRSSATGDYLA